MTDFAPIDPADVQVGMRVRITHHIPASPPWLAADRVAEGVVTSFPRDTRMSVYLDDQDGFAVTIIPSARDIERGFTATVERADWAFNTVALGHLEGEDIDTVYCKRSYGWQDIVGLGQATDIVVTKVLWAPGATA